VAQPIPEPTTEPARLRLVDPLPLRVTIAETAAQLAASWPPLDESTLADLDLIINGRVAEA
jgi:hypothetical protein